MTKHLGIIVLPLFLAACGGGSSGSGNTNNTNGTGNSGNTDNTQGVNSSVMLSGDDATTLGGEAELRFFAYREGFAGADQFLAATSTGTALDMVRVGMGELSVSVIDPAALAASEANATVFNISNLGVSIRFNQNGTSYLYSVACVTGCSGVVFDTAARTVTLDDIQLTESVGGDANSQATGPLTLSGTITWSVNDENAQAGAAGSTNTAPPTSTSNVVLADIVGVWDTSVGSDEMYAVFHANGTYSDYDYLGDEADGVNCYEKETGTITDLGDGRFRIDDSRFGTFSFSGDTLIFEAPEGPYFLESTTLLESDFSPLCD